MKKRFSDEQIIGILKEAGGGDKVGELCRKYDIGDATYYAAKQIPSRPLESPVWRENNKLKKRLA